MSLTYEDLQAIRGVVSDEVSPLAGEIKALVNDVKEIYSIITDARKSDKSFSKLTL